LIPSVFFQEDLLTKRRHLESNRPQEENKLPENKPEENIPPYTSAEDIQTEPANPVSNVDHETWNNPVRDISPSTPEQSNSTGSVPGNAPFAFVPPTQLPPIANPPGAKSQRDQRLWGGWASVGLGAVVFIVDQFVQTIVALFFAIFMLFDQGGQRFNTFDFINRLNNDGLMLSLAVILGSLASTGLIIIFIRIRKVSISEYLGLHRITLKTVGLSLGSVIIIMGFSILASIFAGQPQESDPISNAYQNTPAPWLFWLAIVAFAPVFEEILFRGFLFASLKQSVLGPIWTIILTAGVFAALHAFQYKSVETLGLIFILGVVLGIVRYKTGSLWNSIMLHSFWNLIQMIILAFAV